MKKVWNKYEKCNLLDQKFKICFVSNIHVSVSMFYTSSVTRLGDLEPIGLQIKLTGSFLNFRRAQLIGLQIGQFWKVLFLSLLVAFHEQIHVNLSKL